jgi:hypothetical protein
MDLKITNRLLIICVGDSQGSLTHLLWFDRSVHVSAGSKGDDVQVVSLFHDSAVVLHDKHNLWLVSTVEP